MEAEDQRQSRDRNQRQSRVEERGQQKRYWETPWLTDAKATDNSAGLWHMACQIFTKSFVKCSFLMCYWGIARPTDVSKDHNYIYSALT